jgi:hypothetical protein
MPPIFLPSLRVLHLVAVGSALHGNQVKDPLESIACGVDAIRSGLNVKVYADVVVGSMSHHAILLLNWPAMDRVLTGFAKGHEEVTIIFRFLRQRHVASRNNLAFAYIPLKDIKLQLPSSMQCPNISVETVKTLVTDSSLLKSWPTNHLDKT